MVVAKALLSRHNHTNNNSHPPIQFDSRWLLWLTLCSLIPTCRAWTDQVYSPNHTPHHTTSQHRNTILHPPSPSHRVCFTTYPQPLIDNRRHCGDAKNAVSRSHHRGKWGWWRDHATVPWSLILPIPLILTPLPLTLYITMTLPTLLLGEWGWWGDHEAIPSSRCQQCSTKTSQNWPPGNTTITCLLKQ